ncbi:MAG: HEPN domain-containing protein, partial [Deltaproteobacteria bacterium]|nr:HEPN domain-containing protein [Deltaproteobacteria bacterium]
RASDTSYNRMHAAIPTSIHAKISKLTSEHTLFSRRGNLIFGGKVLHFNPEDAARLLINKAARVGAEQSMRWLTRVHTTEVADIRYVAEVFNLHLGTPYEFSNGVRFGYVDSVPDTKMGGQYKLHHTRPRNFFDADRPIAAIHEVRSVRGKTSFRGYARSESIDLTVVAHALAHEDAAPFVGTSWVEFVDPELEETDFARAGVSMSLYDGPAPGYLPIWSMNTDGVPAIEAVLQLSKDLRNKVEVAASRLIMARNRVSPANKALDGCICLEALLTDNQKTELTYKLALRAALLVGVDVDDRREIRKKLQDFYDLRSRAVHGVVDKSKETDSQVARDGMSICARVLQKIVELKAIPKWADLEMGA